MTQALFEFFGQIVVDGLGYITLRYVFKKKDIKFYSKNPNDDTLIVTYTGVAVLTIIILLIIGMIHFF